MMRKLTALIMLCCAAIAVSADTKTENVLKLSPGILQVKPSFETCSYYFRPLTNGSQKYYAEYRQAGQNAWQKAFFPVTDKPAGIWKGSIFGLKENSQYQLRIMSSDSIQVAQQTFRTWNSIPKIARVIDISRLKPDRTGSLIITSKGKPGAWLKYTAPSGWILKQKYNPANPTPALIFRNAKYAILEGVEISGGGTSAIEVVNCDNVRILNCDISGWGRLGIQHFKSGRRLGQYYDLKKRIINYDAGVCIDNSSNTVVERCYIHDPRSRSNSWMFSHPTGPTAIYAKYNKGGTVLRWNDMVGSDEHRWNDIVESSANSRANGGFFRDSDIYGNYMVFSNDDAIELEGGGMNVRFFNNKIEGTLCGASTGACILGPQYIIGNLFANPGDESGLTLYFFKNSHGVKQGGKRFFFNNTAYGPDCGSYGGYGKPDSNSFIGFMRNNIFYCEKANGTSRYDDFDNNLYWFGSKECASGRSLEWMQKHGMEKNGIEKDPQFASIAKGDFRLKTISPARGKAVKINNICEAGKDLGAFYNKSNLPARPLQFTATPQQIVFEPAQKLNSAQITLLPDSNAKQEVNFSIKKNKVFNWFRVTPMSGTLKPGKPFKLHVAFDSRRANDRPIFRGAFLVRTANGLSRPVSVYSKNTYKENIYPVKNKKTQYIEAEKLTASKYIKIAPRASGGKYIVLNGKIQSPEISCKFSVPAKGKYYLLARASIPQGTMRPRHLEMSLDKHKSQKITVKPSYQWNATVPEKFRVIWLTELGTLSAGKHNINLKPLENVLNLDILIITDNPEVFFIQHIQRNKNIK
jgi:hypothetical protein